MPPGKFLQHNQSGELMLKHRKLVLAVLAALFMGFTLFQVLSLAKENRALKKDRQMAQFIALEKQKYIRNLGDLKKIIDPGNLDATEIIWATMRFVHDHSIHKIDAEHRKYAFNTPVVIQKMLDEYHGLENEKPHLSCGSRAKVMKAILERFGIASRMIQVFSLEKKGGHRLLEVFNPDTKTWQTWDPDSRITFVDLKTHQQLDIIRIITRDKATIGLKDETIFGWNHPRVIYKEHFFNCVMFENEDPNVIYKEHFDKAGLFAEFNYGMFNSIIVVNDAAFDLNRPYAQGLSFKNWAFKRFHFPRFVHLSPVMASN
jgi:hypothetical protein